MRSLLQTAASLALKIAYEDGSEKLIGFARALSYTVTNGQKSTYVVDSPIPAEIAQGAGPSFVKGSIITYLPKGSTPESSGLIPYRVDENGTLISPLSKYMHIRVYDRATGNLVMALEHCKVGSYSVAVQAKGIVEVNLQFDGMLATPGLTL